MQLHFTREECEALEQVIADARHSSCDGLPSLTQFLLQPHVKERLIIGTDLLHLDVSHNLRLDFEELDTLADCLREFILRLSKRQAETNDPEQAILKRKQGLLEHLLEKVTEARAMV